MKAKRNKKTRTKRKTKKAGKTTSEKLFLFLIILVLVLGSLNVAKAKGWLIPKQPLLIIAGNTVRLDAMSLDQKIAQMLVVQGNVEHMPVWKNMQVGGIHLYGRKTEHVFLNTILDFQYLQPIKMFTTVDLEGCVNPFQYYKSFKPAMAVTTIGAAFEKGVLEGQYLNSLGINVNFAPVVDLDDEIWKCRAFPGNEKKISELAQSYILGLQNQGVIGTVKHYPGKTLVVRDPHKYVVAAEIAEEDVYPYQYLIEKGDAKAIMVSHMISSGVVDSAGVPAVVSKKVIDDLKKDYGGLIISDEIHMLGLKDFYDTIDEMYIAVFQAGNDVILNFQNDPNEVYRMVQVIKRAIKDGVIDENEIDKSVTKILIAKGYQVR